MPLNQGPPPGLFVSEVKRVNDRDIVHSESDWARLAETATPIGECRQMYPHGKCDGVMFALPMPDYQFDSDPIHWQGAECNVCKAEVAIPNRRALARSSVHGEMPLGYWEDRLRRMRPMDPGD